MTSRIMPFVLALALVSTGLLALAPTASASPCEVPGCQIAGAAVCIVYESGTMVKQYKTAPETLVDCMTAPA